MQITIAPASVTGPGESEFERTLPQGDWYIIPPIEGDWKIDAVPDGDGGQHLTMIYAEGYSASVHMKGNGVLQVSLYRNDSPHPMEIDQSNLHIWFRDRQDEPPVALKNGHE